MTPDIINKIWPEWKTVRLLGEGSFGSVFEVLRENGGVTSRAAVKIISIPARSSELETLRSEGMTDDASRTYFRNIVDNFLKEITIMESFKALQNIVSIEDYQVREKPDSIGYDIYIRMELLKPFNQALQEKKLNVSEVVKLGTDICTALEYCARKNIIHRDIKPENIFINEFGDYKLGDFGVARAIASDASMTSTGTFSYMAPEVYRGSHYDATTDLYSLGLVLYRLTNNNRLPFLDTQKQILTPDERARAVERRMEGEILPPPCEAPAALSRVILKACDPDPAYRYRTAAEMKAALESALVQFTSADSSTGSIREAQRNARIQLEKALGSDDNKTAATVKAGAPPVSADSSERTYVISEHYPAPQPQQAGSKKLSIGIIAAIIAFAAVILGLGVVLTLNIISLRSSIESGKAESAFITAEASAQPSQEAPSETVLPDSSIQNDAAAVYAHEHILEYNEKLDENGSFYGSFNIECAICGPMYEESLLADCSQLYWTHSDGWAQTSKCELTGIGDPLIGNLKFYDAENHSYTVIKNTDSNLSLWFYDHSGNETSEEILKYGAADPATGRVTYFAVNPGTAVFVYLHNGTQYLYGVDVCKNSIR